MFATIEAAIEAFRTIDGVVSVDVGIGSDLSPADFPLIRIEPETYTGGKPYNARTGLFNVVFGVPIADSEGLFNVYRELHRLEADIRAKIKAMDGRWLATVFFDRRVRVPFKLATVRCELREIIAAPAP